MDLDKDKNPAREMALQPESKSPKKASPSIKAKDRFSSPGRPRYSPPRKARLKPRLKPVVDGDSGRKLMNNGRDADELRSDMEIVERILTS